MDQNLIKEIREKTDIVEFIGKYITLTKRGKNYFGLCPFHADTNPSLSVSREKQIYKCFVCGEAGNVFNFLMKYENISFREALKIIGDSIGIEVKSDNKVIKNKYDDLYEICELANTIYQNNLMSKEGIDAREYLKKRNLDINTIKEFGIGLSLNKRDRLTSLLVKQGYNINTLNELGLSSGEVDTYINRIIFPLYSIDGRVNGFSGRIYHGEAINKYLNTKETPIFKKGENIFNYKRARDEVRKNGFVIIMEGFMAVIRAYTIGVKNCIALMGTALTIDQINLIKKLSMNVYLCFDGDKAGINATINNGKMLKDNNFNVKVIPLSDSLDPDDYIIKYGSEKFYSLISSAISYNDYKIKNLKQGVNFNSADELTNYIDLVISEISTVDSEIKREIMLKNLANDTNVWYNTLEKKLNELLSKKEKTKVSIITHDIKERKKNKYEKTMQEIVFYMLNNKEVINLVVSSQVYFPNDIYRNLVREISDFYEKFGYINIADFLSYEKDPEMLKYLNEIIAMEIDSNVDSTVILELLKVIKDYNVSLEIKRLEKLIKEEVDPLEQAKISNEIMKLKIRE
ncbi:MAG: DNA primase [Bacilli bacterium]|nr:DNA primase [Bacilli bacterium]